MAPSMRNTGPACCCCKDTIRGNEQRLWCETQGEGASAFLYRTPKDTDDPRELVYTMNLRPAATLDYSPGTTASPDYKNRRLYYSYIENYRPVGPIEDKTTYVKWWDGKSSGSAVGTAVATLASYLIDSLAADPDNEHVYFTGHDYPYPDNSVDWSVDLKRMDYDGANLTALDTIDVFRAGGGFGPLAGVGSTLLHRPLARLYYVKRQNVTTSTNDDWVIEICYRELADITTEVVIYSESAFSSADPRPALQLVHCLSFDLENEKIYFVEQYETAGALRQSNVKYADMDGSNVATLYASTDPFSVNFVRYSNSFGKILHEDFDRIAAAPRDGLYLREPDFTLIEQLGKSSGPEVNGVPYPAPCASYLWCGFEGASA